MGAGLSLEVWTRVEASVVSLLESSGFGRRDSLTCFCRTEHIQAIRSLGTCDPGRWPRVCYCTGIRTQACFTSSLPHTGFLDGMRLEYSFALCNFGQFAKFCACKGNLKPDARFQTNNFIHRSAIPYLVHRHSCGWFVSKLSRHNGPRSRSRPYFR